MKKLKLYFNFRERSERQSMPGSGARQGESFVKSPADFRSPRGFRVVRHVVALLFSSVSDKSRYRKLRALHQ
jgi:hypothetical protein